MLPQNISTHAGPTVQACRGVPALQPCGIQHCRAPRSWPRLGRPQAGTSGGPDRSEGARRSSRFHALKTTLSKSNAPKRRSQNLKRSETPLTLPKKRYRTPPTQHKAPSSTRVTAHTTGLRGSRQERERQAELERQWAAPRLAREAEEARLAAEAEAERAKAEAEAKHRARSRAAPSFEVVHSHSEA